MNQFPEMTALKTIAAAVDKNTADDIFRDYLGKTDLTMPVD